MGAADNLGAALIDMGLRVLNCSPSVGEARAPETQTGWALGTPLSAPSHCRVARLGCFSSNIFPSMLYDNFSLRPYIYGFSLMVTLVTLQHVDCNVSGLRINSWGRDTAAPYKVWMDCVVCAPFDSNAVPSWG